MTTQKKVTDISKPGTSPAAATSRPVIIGHGHRVQDPMVAANNTSEDVAINNQPVEPPHKSPTTSTKVITPITATAGEGKDVAPPQIDENKTMLAVAESATTKKSHKDEAAQDEASIAHIEKLRAAKTYFLPINQVAKRRNMRIVEFFIVLIVVLAGAYLLADAGVVDAPFALPINLI